MSLPTAKSPESPLVRGAPTDHPGSAQRTREVNLYTRCKGASAYDGKTVRDNNKYTKVKILEPCDRTKEGARLVFDSLFEGLEVRIKNIYELRKM